MIEVFGQKIVVSPFKGSENEGEIIKFALQTYGIVLQVGTGRSSEVFSFDEFATRISKVFDSENPRNKEVISILRQVHQRNVVLH